MKCWGGGW